MSDDFKQIIRGQDSQEYGWKNVLVEHKERFRCSAESIKNSSSKTLKERKKKETRPDLSLKVDRSFYQRVSDTT